MEPRTRAKGLPKETQRDGFSGKEPATDILQAQRQVIRIANRQEAEMFQELVGKEVFLLWDGMGSVLGTLAKAGTNFVKLTDVKYSATHPDPGGYGKVIRELKASGDAADGSCDLLIQACPSLILNKSEISAIVPASEHEK
jgi:hypothetical protein